MWAAGHPDQFAEALSAGNTRTVRGIHAKWKEVEQERARATKWPMLKRPGARLTLRAKGAQPHEAPRLRVIASQGRPF